MMRSTGSICGAHASTSQGGGAQRKRIIVRALDAQISGDWRRWAKPTLPPPVDQRISYARRLPVQHFWRTLSLMGSLLAKLRLKVTEDTVEQIAEQEVALHLHKP